MGDIPFDALTPLGALCLVLALPYLQMARGKLHPQSTIDRMVADHTREMEDISHDRDEWRAAHRISETARQVGQDQVKELLENGRTTAAALTVIQRAAERGGQ